MYKPVLERLTGLFVCGLFVLLWWVSCMQPAAATDLDLLLYIWEESKQPVCCMWKDRKKPPAALQRCAVWSTCVSTWWVLRAQVWVQQFAVEWADTTNGALHVQDSSNICPLDSPCCEHNLRWVDHLSHFDFLMQLVGVKYSQIPGTP